MSTSFGVISRNWDIPVRFSTVLAEMTLRHTEKVFKAIHFTGGSHVHSRRKGQHVADMTVNTI